MKSISYTDIENLLSESNKEDIVAKVSEIPDLKICNCSEPPWVRDKICAKQRT